MDYEFDLPIDGDIDEKALENRGSMPTGYYRAKCTDAFPDMKDNQGIKLVFVITAGPFEGREVKDTLWDPTLSEDEDKAKIAANRMALITKRLGARIEGTKRVNIRLGIGKEVVLHLKRQSDPYCPHCQANTRIAKERKCKTCGTGFQWIEKEDGFANIDFEGVYPLDHPKLGDQVRKDLDLPPARAEAADGEAGSSGSTTVAGGPTPPAKPKAPPPAAKAPAAPDKPASTPKSPPPTHNGQSRQEAVNAAIAGF